MAYAPGTRTLLCGHCGTTEDLGPVIHDQRELSYQLFVEGATDAETIDASAVQCSSCGAEVHFAADERSRACAFCATPLVATPERRAALQVHALLAMDVTETTALARMGRWKKSIWFAPNNFAASARTEKPLQPMYLPYWTFDAETYTQYSGERGRKRDNDNSKKGGSDMRWSRVKGHVKVLFDDLAVPASRHLSDTLRRRLRRWDFTLLERYDPRLLLGFSSEISAMTLEEAFAQARKDMAPVIEDHIRADIGGDDQRIRSKETQVENVRFRHVLVPVWLGAYRYGGKVYQIAVNGRTGQIAAERPWSWPKIALVAALLIAISGAIALGVRALNTL
jgi:hypothetical protein